MDFDLNSGMTRFMLKLNSTYSSSTRRSMLPQWMRIFGLRLRPSSAKMDVVHAGTPNPEVRVQDLQIQHLLDFSGAITRSSPWICRAT
jgi:hypothetical protein